MQKPLNILFLSGHLFFSKRKAGFHHLANAFIESGHLVNFLTAPNSLLSLLKKDQNRSERNQSIFYALFPFTEDRVTVSSYISLLHNTPHKGFQKIQYYLFLFGYSAIFREKFDVIIFESGASLMLFDRITRKNPTAKLIYRVSDDLAMLGHKKLIIKKETSTLSKFHLISSPSSYISARLLKSDPSIAIANQYHGINKKMLDMEYSTPYIDKSKVNLIFVGTGYLDYNFLKIASKLNDNWLFHIIGPLKKEIESSNIIYYGEMHFIDTIPYIKYADVGLQTLERVKGIEVMEKTLKFVQYSYFKLPIIAPAYMEINEENTFNYQHNETDIATAIQQALQFDRKKYDNTWIKSWEEISMEMLQWVN